MLTEGMYIADRYEIIGKIGAGGMSDVYKAKDLTLGRFVAIKVLKPEFSEDVGFVTKFRTEAQSAAALQHPNIVNIYDVGSENGLHYIVMEYVEGITLKTYIEKKGQLSFKEAVSIAIQVGRGIEAAHNNQIIHRDIKPQNIMISTEGKVKVMDFGIARAASSNTISSDVMGSVHYSSPEQARNGFVDGKSDIYSLGIVMYEMVTGRVPFDGDTTVAVAIQHLQEEMVKPSAYAPNLPISMEKIILKCTQKNPDRRYENMSALLSDLRKALVSPNEDFVVMVSPLSQDKTRVIGEEDVNRIRQEANTVHIGEQLLKEADREMGIEEDVEDDELDDEDDDGELNPKMEKAITIMGIVTAIVIVGIIIYLIGSFFGLFQFASNNKENNTQTTETQQTETSESKTSESEALTDENSVEMIDVKGLTYEEAQKQLNAIGLGIHEESTASSDEYEAGRILQQSVEKGVRVELHTTITVVISSGSGSIEVPSVTGSTAENAESTLTAQGFTVSKEYAYDNSVTQGNVISQSPASGSSAKKGDTITITISQGAEPAVVPNVVGQTEDNAKAMLSNVGLNYNITSVYSSTVEAGYVVEQNITAESQVQKGTTVNLTVSLGAEPVEDVTTTTYRASFRVQKLSGDVSNVSGANILLYDGQDGSGNVLEQWMNQSIDSFGEDGLSLSKGGLLVSGGSVMVQWLDLDGNVIGTPQIQNMTFNRE
uniref:Stk1 family PASTA domain-containing Ser/Thr kinase n=1 Tax=Roseburia sp. TaxID=2049040 RepID=UPI003FEE1D70